MTRNTQNYAFYPTFTYIHSTWLSKGSHAHSVCVFWTVEGWLLTHVSLKTGKTDREPDLYRTQMAIFMTNQLFSTILTKLWSFLGSVSHHKSPRAAHEDDSLMFNWCSWWFTPSTTFRLLCVNEVAGNIDQLVHIIRHISHKCVYFKTRQSFCVV